MQGRKACAALLSAVSILTAIVTTAAANRSVNIASGVGPVSAAAVTFIAEELRITCEVSLNGSLNRSVAKRAGVSVGSVSVASAANCRNGTVIFLSPPWEVQYVSFSGTLPSISSGRLKLVGAAFLVNTLGGLAQCLYRGDPQATSTGGTTATGVRVDETINIPLSRRLSGICTANLTVAGLLETNVPATLTLI